MAIFKLIKPEFWDHHDLVVDAHNKMFDFRRKWKLIVLVTAVVALTPLIVMTFIDFRMTKNTIESDMLQRTSNMVSTTWRSINFFFNERKTALKFIAHDNTYEELTENHNLAALLTHLDKTIDGFTDIGILDTNGQIRAYSGPIQPMETQFCDQTCFRETVNRGAYISDLRPGTYGDNHLFIGIKHQPPNGPFFILRAALDTGPLQTFLENLELDPQDDAFIVNYNGKLQTTSRHHGKRHQFISLPVPPVADKVRVIESLDKKDNPSIIGYAYIPETPFILMIVKPKTELMELLFKPRLKLIGFLIISIIFILLVILGSATYLVNKIHTADQKRVTALRRAEYSNKLASLGRLASGVAHEINNPLAIINQKAGLIKDLFILNKQYHQDPKLLEPIETIINTVTRASLITRNLLNFSRHMETRFEEVNLKGIINELITFMTKEAEKKEIRIVLNLPEEPLQLESDRGNLQQIFLNLFNNAFEAMPDGGQLDIQAIKNKDADITVTVTDTGCGIPAEDLQRIFDPFFSTKSEKSGTGLGLSITYGLIQEIGGDIHIQSQIGTGSKFILTLPLNYQPKDRDKTCTLS